jgi:hypothetical protein
LHSLFQDSLGDFLGQTAHYRNSIVECLFRHKGNLEEERSEVFKGLINPLAWFTNGVRVAISIPLLTLGAFGVIGSATISTIAASSVFRLLGSLASLIGFASAVIGIATGWDQFIALLLAHKLWK